MKFAVGQEVQRINGNYATLKEGDVLTIKSIENGKLQFVETFGDWKPENFKRLSAHDKSFYKRS